MSSARKSIIWEFPFDDMEVELDRLLESLDEQISDVPADYLSKGYLIFIVRLPHAQLQDQADGSVQIEINQIDPKDIRILDGLCWKDWRSGTGRNYARGLLRTCCPKADTPFVHISVGLEGRVVQRINESYSDALALTDTSHTHSRDISVRDISLNDNLCKKRRKLVCCCFGCFGDFFHYLCRNNYAFGKDVD